jgi:DNA mismatch endonuclease (patch repair protein)
MASVKNKNSKPEVNLRKALFAKGLRYRIHVSNLPGHPDVVFPKYKAVIFIHGCFWHRHGCKYGNLPVTNTDFWRKKFQKNVVRDQLNIAQLEKLGWRVRIIWSCQLKNRQKVYSDESLQEVMKWLVGEKVSKSSAR